MKDLIKRGIFRIERSFFSRVVRRALGMMIPLILAGALASAVRNLPVPTFQSMLDSGQFYWLEYALEFLYNGTFGLFSVMLVIAVSLSYAMELNVTLDYMVMYVIVALTAFGVQLNVGTELYDPDALGTLGCFSAMVVAFLSCIAYTKMRKVHWLVLEKYSAGFGGICVPAIQTFLPLLVICVIVGIFNYLLYAFFHVSGSYGLCDKLFYTIFDSVSTSSNFLLGLLYTFFVNFLWFFGLHGSHILEPVAHQNMVFTGDTIFSKSFYDVFVSMGGCGTTICVLIALLLFFRKERSGKLAGLSSFITIFNINEVLTFGIPIIMNPSLFIPFVLTPVVCYCISYAASVLGLVPVMVNEVVWTAPVGMGGYLATGSVRGIILQLVCIAVGVAIYFPFLRLNQRMETERGKEQVKILVKELQEKEEKIEQPMFLLRGDYIGSASRLLLLDLKNAIRQGDLYMLYQPQVRSDGTCIGAEALLRWKHPVYGMIYPPLIIFLAEEGKILPELEQFILEEVVRDIADIQKQYDREFKVSVNFTAHSLLWDIEEYLDKMMQKYQVPPKKLWIEITEQDILLKTDMVINRLNVLKKAGHKLLIDDFGMGHTSLLYLQSEYFDIVKLDGSLTRPLLTSKTNQKIVASIVELGNELGIDVIAEYVETKEQQKMLEKLGCNCYQGYLYSKPIVLEEFILYMKNK